MNQTIPPDYVLHAALRFSRRIANYLYLPILVVSLFVLLVALVDVIENRQLHSQAMWAALAGLLSLTMWRFARWPRPTILLLQGILLGLLTVAWVAWLPVALYLGELRIETGTLGAVRVLAGLLWFLFVVTGMCGAAAASLRYWRQLSRVHGKELRKAVDRLRTQTSLPFEILAKAPVRAVRFAAGSIDLLAPEQLEPAPREEIEAGLWKDEWVVIAVEEPGGKPIYMDTAAERLPVFLARPEPESWHHSQIADSLVGFLQALTAVGQMHSSEEVGIRNRLLPDEAEERVLAAIERDNPHAEVWFWKRLLVPPQD